MEQLDYEDEEEDEESEDDDLEEVPEVEVERVESLDIEAYLASFTVCPELCPFEPVCGKGEVACPCYIGPAVPRHYQETGISFLRDNKHALLTDAPGMGKTIQAAYAASTPVLIVAPKHLTEQWAEWLEGRDEKSMERNDGKIIANVPGKVNLVTFGWGDRYRKARRLREGGDWVIVNYEMLRTHFADLKQQYYSTMILDESHHVKTHTAKQSKAAVSLSDDIENVFLLTATPIMREVDDLYNQLRILEPDLFTSYTKFIQMFCVTEWTRFGPQIYGIKKEMLPHLEELLDVVRLGRSYEQVGRELPPVIEKYVKIELPPETRRIYNECADLWRIEIESQGEGFSSWMAVMHALRRIVTGTFKLDAVYDLLADEVRKATTFTWYRETAHRLATRLGEDAFEVVTGEDAVAVRRQKALGNKHVIVTILALSEGIDLSDARTVVFAEENWTPGSNYQALSRVRRERVGGNNTEPVVVYYVMCDKTIDEVIHRRAKSRSGTIKEVIKEALYL